MKLLKYIIYCFAFVLFVGCVVDESTIDGPAVPEPGHGNGDGGAGDNGGSEDVGEDGDVVFPSDPTVPMKKRPIVPSTKLPRPRCVEVYFLSQSSLMVRMAADAGVATLTITEHDGGKAVSYIVDSEFIELENIPECGFDIAVEVGGEVETYTVMEE